MQRIGIIGSGAIGTALARLAVAAGHEVMIGNSRGPESLAELVADLGPRAAAGRVEDVAGFGDLVVLAVPLAAYGDLPAASLEGRTVLSTGNYYPSRDGRIEQLDSLRLTTAELEQELLPGTRLVKAFNNIVAHHIPLLAGSEPRTALPVAGDDPEAEAQVSSTVQSLGFDTVDAGGLAESWRFEPEAAAYTVMYAASRQGFADDYLADRGAPVTAERVREVLASAERVDVAARQF